jgi:hypothetical protein
MLVVADGCGDRRGATSPTRVSQLDHSHCGKQHAPMTVWAGRRYASPLKLLSHCSTHHTTPHHTTPHHTTPQPLPGGGALLGRPAVVAGQRDPTKPGHPIIVFLVQNAVAPIALKAACNIARPGRDWIQLVTVVPSSLQVVGVAVLGEADGRTHAVDWCWGGAQGAPWLPVSECGAHSA